MQRDRFVALDGLRGVAAIAVMLHHTPGVPARLGHLSVDLFFLLSGFVIAKSYEQRLVDGRLSVRAYAALRLERLYPLLFIGSFIGIALWGLGVGEAHFPDARAAGLAVTGQVLLVPLFAAPLLFAFNNAYWSICFELMANLAHALAAKWLSDRVLWATAGLSAVAMVLAGRHYGTLDLGWNRGNFLAGLPRVGFGYFGGVLLWRTRAAWMGRVPALPFVGLSLVLFALTNLPLSLIGAANGNALVELGIVLVVFPPLVMAGSMADGSRLAGALGTLSFPLYAVHYPILKAAGLPHGGLALGAVLALLVGGAWALGEWVDEPLGEWRRARRKARTAAARPGYA